MTVIECGISKDKLQNSVFVRDILGKNNENAQKKTQTKSESSSKISAETKSAGRPEKADGEKSEKTI